MQRQLQLHRALELLTVVVTHWALIMIHRQGRGCSRDAGSRFADGVLSIEFHGVDRRASSSTPRLYMSRPAAPQQPGSQRGMSMFGVLGVNAQEIER